MSATPRAEFENVRVRYDGPDLAEVASSLGLTIDQVIDLHGGGGRAEGQERISGLDAVADANGFIVVHPQGVERSWADGRGTSPADRSGAAEPWRRADLGVFPNARCRSIRLDRKNHLYPCGRQPKGRVHHVNR